MTLYLTQSDNLAIKAWSEVVDVGDYRISYPDFCQMIEYFLVNAPLQSGDARLKLMTNIAGMNVIQRDGRSWLGPENPNAYQEFYNGGHS